MGDGPSDRHRRKELHCGRLTSTIMRKPISTRFASSAGTGSTMWRRAGSFVNLCGRDFFMGRYIGLLLVAVLFANGCSQLQEFAIRDAQAAKTRATLHGDIGGSMCWAFVEKQLQTIDPDLQVLGLMDAVEALRIARLNAPATRQRLVAECGEVFTDIVIELAKRAAKRGG